MVGLTLGLAGDRRVVPFLIEYLSDNAKSPYLRERAGRALTRVPDARAIPALKKALDDPDHSVTYMGESRTRYYDIRAAAGYALNKIKWMGVTLPDDVQQALDKAVIVEREIVPTRQ
jgi:HEAT repeat protein